MATSALVISSKTSSLDASYKATFTSTDAAARLVPPTSPIVVDISNAAKICLAKADDERLSGAATRADLRAAVIVITPRESRYQILTALFARTLPSCVQARWGHSRPYFPSFQHWIIARAKGWVLLLLA